MDRRDFLKKAGQSGIALASAPALAHALSQVARAGGGTNFHLTAFSGSDTIDGVQHWMGLTGAGWITPGGISGGGSYNHFNNAAPGVPKPILGTGTWKAKGLVSYNQIGTWGGLAAGTLVAEIHLVPVGRSPVAATLQIDCNLGFAGLFTGRPEGYTLTIPGAPFGPFTPLGIGLTVFTTGNEHRD